MPYSLTLIDVCLPCYLQDHHNRPGELLLSVPVTGSDRNGDVRRMVHDKLQTAEWGLPEDFSYEEADAAIDECFNQADGRKTFDRDLDKRPGEHDESCYAYFLLTYGEDNNL